jgi:hypothetical protein
LIFNLQAQVGFDHFIGVGKGSFHPKTSVVGIDEVSGLTDGGWDILDSNIGIFTVAEVPFFNLL